MMKGFILIFVFVCLANLSIGDYVTYMCPDGREVVDQNQCPQIFLQPPPNQYLCSNGQLVYDLFQCPQVYPVAPPPPPQPEKIKVHCGFVTFLTCWAECAAKNHGVPNCCQTNYAFMIPTSFDCECKTLEVGGPMGASSVTEMLASQIGCSIQTSLGAISG